MSIREQIKNAVGRAAGTLAIQNVVYLGHEQVLELRCETKAVGVINRFMGLKVVRVQEENWLQVGYVEGVK